MKYEGGRVNKMNTFPIPKLPSAIPQTTLQWYHPVINKDDLGVSVVENPTTLVEFRGTILPLSNQRLRLVDNNGVYRVGDCELFTDDTNVAQIRSGDYVVDTSTGIQYKVVEQRTYSGLPQTPYQQLILRAEGNGSDI